MTVSVFLSLLPPFQTTKHDSKTFHWNLYSILPLLSTLIIQHSILLLTALCTFFHLFFLPHVFPTLVVFCRCFFLESKRIEQAWKFSEGWRLHTYSLYANLCTQICMLYKSLPEFFDCTKLHPAYRNLPDGDPCAPTL